MNQAPEHKGIYSEAYWGLILPAVTAAALIGMLLKPIVVDSIAWWGCVFFVVYYGVQHTRREKSSKYGPRSFVADVLGIVVFFYVAHESGLFDPGTGSTDPPAHIIFFSILSIPILGAIGRYAELRKPRWILTLTVFVSALLGGVGSLQGWPGAIGLGSMAVLIVSLVIYLICNFVEDGGSRKCGKCWFCR
jgi:hypothetical protein